MATITIAIAGITGTLGRLITKHLLSHPDVHINGLCRNPSKLPLSLQTDPRLTLFQANASDVKVIRRALRKADVAICCYLGDATTVMVDGQKTLIDACIDEGVRRYIASDWSMDFRKLALGEHPPKDPMKHVQAYLEEKSDEITAVHVLNACFLERPWVGLWDAQKECFRYWGTGDEKWEFTSYNNAAEYTAEVALDREANGWLSFRGDHVSIRDIAADFKAVYDCEPKLERLGSLDDLFKLMHTTRDRDPSNFGAWLGLFYTYYSLNGQTALPEPLDCSRYPNVQVDKVRDFFTKTPKRRLGKKSFFKSLMHTDVNNSAI
ncbi:NmrA-like family protein [Fusarium oxysporum]|nr:NmrA-like family protein [Fusarium oxysporum]